MHELHLQIWCQLSHSFPDLIRTPFQVVRFAFDSVIRKEDEKLCVNSFQYRSLSSDNVITWKNNELSSGNQYFAPFYIQNYYGLPSSKTAEVPKGLTIFISALEELFSHVFYLGPTRVNPRRFYQWEGGHPEHSGQWGDKTIDALLSARVLNLKTSHEAEEVPIEQRISDWLQKMDLAHSFSLDWARIQGKKKLRSSHPKNSCQSTCDVS